MFWSVDLDDFEGKFCKYDNYIKNPLQKAIIAGIRYTLPIVIRPPPTSVDTGTFA